MGPRKLTPLRRAVRSGLTVLAMLVVYAFVPIPGRNGPLVVDLIVLAAGVAGLAYVVVALARQAMKEDDDSGVGIEAIIAVFYAFLVFYSVIYLGIAAQPDEFVGMANRVDSLYFTLTTLSTVGYGDIHAVGTAARVAVTTQLFLDLVLVGLAARLVGPALARSVAARSGSSEEPGRRLRRRRGRADN
jgi:hypothetical protein